MRIISMLIALAVLGVTIAPQTALAKEIKNTNTKIEFKIDKQIILKESFLGQAEELLQEKVEKERIKSLEEEKNGSILDKWKKKQNWDRMPEGEFTVNASAYTAAADECGKSDGITASGIKVKAGRTLACPPNFPFGAKIKIEGVGIRVCEDRGGAIKGNHVDIYVVTKKEAFAFGRKNLKAEVID